MQGIAWKQRILRKFLIQIFHDNQRFGDERLTVIGDQMESRYFATAVHIDEPVGFLVEIDVDRVMGNVLGIQDELNALSVRTESHGIETQFAIERQLRFTGT